MSIVRYRWKSDQYQYRCKKCCTTSSIRTGTFFSKSHLSLQQIICLTFCWAAKIPATTTVAMAEVCLSSVCQWYQYLREMCSTALIESDDYTLGGDGVVVQIDESVVTKRKYHVGRMVPQQWVFGLYDTVKKIGHIQFVDDRSADTLIPIIQKHVKPGSIIFSDQWAAYRRLPDYGYIHKTVNHSENFVDPETGVCTNAIEAYWSRVKRQIRLNWLTHRDQIPLRIDEFLWRERLPSKKIGDVFQQMLLLLRAK